MDGGSSFLNPVVKSFWFGISPDRYEIAKLMALPNANRKSTDHTANTSIDTYFGKKSRANRYFYLIYNDRIPKNDRRRFG
jgi:hypothetical protein